MCDHRLFGRGGVINGNNGYLWSTVGFTSIKWFMGTRSELSTPPSLDEKPNVSADQGGYRDVVIIYNSYLDWFTSTVIGAMYVGLSLRNQREHYHRLPLSALAFYCQSRGISQPHRR